MTTILTYDDRVTLWAAPKVKRVEFFVLAVLDVFLSGECKIDNHFDKAL